jgi:hypothetical protein
MSIILHNTFGCDFVFVRLTQGRVRESELKRERLCRFKSIRLPSAARLG